MEARAYLRNARIAPRKVQIVLDLIRNKPAKQALAILKYTPKAACEPVEKLLKSASFVDEYRGKQVPEGKKSVTIRLVIGADDKTLTSEQIEKVAATVTRTLEHTAGAQTRF